MKRLARNVLAVLLIGLFLSSCLREVPSFQADIDYPNFLSRSDLVWTSLPDDWSNGPFTGNGIIGTVFYKQENGLYFEISRTDAYDHRNGTSIHTSRYRLPNGNFLLNFKGENPQGKMKLDLWNAEVRGEISTDLGTLKIRNFTHADEEVIVLEIIVGGDEKFDLQWHPDIVQTSRPQEIGKPGTTPYPKAIVKNSNGTNVSVQSMPESEIYNTQGRGEGALATAWRIVEKGAGKYLVYISEVYSHPGKSAVIDAAINVEKASKSDIAEFEKSHREWWHNYYSKSFVSIPDSRLEGFYWIQMYKMASATREDRPMIDLAGPWYKRGTPWPGIWWNLNVQCTYAPFPFSNHIEEGSSLINWMWKYRENLEKNAKGEGRYAIGRSSPITLERDCPTSNYEFGNFGYALFNVWEQYRVTMDDVLLEEKLYPLIKGHYRFIRDFYLEKLDDGKYHIKPSGSPEYTRDGFPPPADCNYNLSILKWMLNTMVYSNKRLMLQDPIINEVNDVLANLADYPIDQDEGFMVGADQKFSYSHRHWSHLFMIYPFYEYTYDDQAQGELIDKSLAHWLSYSEAYRGYSWLAAASIAAMKGDGNIAVDYIYASLDHDRYPTHPNTFYIEAGPVIETPLLAARTIQDLLLTSYNDIIRVFPAVPDKWKDVSFHAMRAEGAFLISAQRKNGKTDYIRIESLAGEPCRVKSGFEGKVKALGQRNFKLRRIGDEVVEIDLKKGEWVILYSGTLPELSINPVALTEPANYWGTITGGGKKVGSLILEN